MSLKKLFNWLSAPLMKDGPHPYTADHLALRVLQKVTHGPRTVSTPDWLNRGGRIAERTVTLASVFGAVALGVVVGGPVGLLAGIGVAVLGKGTALGAGAAAKTGIKAVARKLGR